MVLKLKPGVTLYLARHGQTEANVENRFSGKRDTPLTDKGREQARALGEILKRERDMRPALAFIASPLARACTTMKIVLSVLGLPENDFTTDARLQEIDLGDWDQLTDDEARARDPGFFEARAHDKWHLPAPGGETYEQAAIRASAWAQSLTGDTFAVSHGALTRILRGLVGGNAAEAIATERGRDEPQGVVVRLKDGEVAQLNP